MVGESRPAGVSERLTVYVVELREFFQSRGVPSGAPADVIGFADRVAEPGPFAEEMGSMVRSIVYREDETLGRGELLELIAVAVGGPGVEGTSPEIQASVRKIFLFLTAALRQDRTFSEAPPPEEQSSEEPVTAGRILAVAAAQAAPEAPRPPQRTQETPQRVPAGDGMLFRAVSMAEAESAESAGDEGKQRSMAQGWLVPAIAAGLAVIGIGVYVARPSAAHKESGTSGSAETQPSLAPASACVGPMRGGVSRISLDERSHWARNLMDQKLYEAALPELRDIAKADPGFPGIQLQVSEALMNLKRPEDAREAIDTQIATSECLAKLPSASLDTYCSQQFASSGGCREQLGHIREAAQLQAALVHLELGHRMAPEGATALGTPDLPPEALEGRTRSAPQPAPVHVRKVAPLPAASDGDAAAAPMPRRTVSEKPAASKKLQGDDALRKGEGTDSTFGAYQKPE
jgi:hypothetical protein